MKLAPEETAVMVVSDHGMHATNNERAFSALDTPQEMNSGHHEDGPPGVFIAAGGPFRSPTDPSQRRRMVTVGGVMDVTPTLLAIKGVPAGEDMYGKAMTGIVRPDWIHRVSGTSVSTHDTEDWLNAHKERIREAVNQTERLEQLRSLGYIR
jgi:arylsulfatase A-like enzyme